MWRETGNSASMLVSASNRLSQVVSCPRVATPEGTAPRFEAAMARYLVVDVEMMTAWHKVTEQPVSAQEAAEILIRTLEEDTQRSERFIAADNPTDPNSEFLPGGESCEPTVEAVCRHLELGRVICLSIEAEAQPGHFCDTLIVPVDDEGNPADSWRIKSWDC